MQGLRDRNEEDISKAGRVELERVLREEWESKDRVSLIASMMWGTGDVHG